MITQANKKFVALIRHVFLCNFDTLNSNLTSDFYGTDFLQFFTFTNFR